MDAHSAWERALKETEIIRSRVLSLNTFGETHVPYILLSASSINTGDTLVRKGEVLVHKPSLILPPYNPQFEGFDFNADENSMMNFLLLRGITLPSMKYDNKIHTLDIFEGGIQDAISHFGNRLQREENTTAGLLVGPEDLWPFSLLIFICSQILKNSEGDIRRLLDDYHRKKEQ